MEMNLTLPVTKISAVEEDRFDACNADSDFSYISDSDYDSDYEPSSVTYTAEELASMPAELAEFAAKKCVNTATTTTTTTTTTTEEECHFPTLSDDAVSHIFGFLNRKDTKQMKSTCKRLSKLALSEMQKHEIGVICNLDKDEENMSNCLRYTRHNGNKTFSDLCIAWQQKYDIPKDQQLILPFQPNKHDSFSIPITHENVENVTQSINTDAKIRDIPKLNDKKQFLLFDKRQVTQMDGQKFTDLAENQNLLIVQHEKNTELVVIDEMNSFLDIQNYFGQEKEILCRISDRMDAVTEYVGERTTFAWNNVPEKYMEAPILSLFQFHKCLMIQVKESKH